MKLRGVRKSDVLGLSGHGVGYFTDAVTDVDDGGLARSVEIAAAFGVDDPAAIAADGGGEGFLEVSREERGHGRGKV